MSVDTLNTTQGHIMEEAVKPVSEDVLAGYSVMFLVEAEYFDTTKPTVVPIRKASAQIDELEQAWSTDAIQNYTVFLICTDTHTVTEVTNSAIYELLNNNKEL